MNTLKYCIVAKLLTNVLNYVNLCILINNDLNQNVGVPLMNQLLSYYFKLYYVSTCFLKILILHDFITTFTVMIIINYVPKY